MELQKPQRYGDHHTDGFSVAVTRQLRLETGHEGQAGHQPEPGLPAHDAALIGCTGMEIPQVGGERAG